MKRFLVSIAAALVLLSVPAFAEPAAAGRTLTVRTFQFKHKQAEQAASVIKTLLSAEGSMSIQPASNSLLVTDGAENLKKIAAALADFDGPAQAFRLSIRLVVASRADAASAPPIAQDLRDVAPKLALLRYNVLDRIGATEVAGREGEPGGADIDGYRADFHFGDYDAASDSVKIADFKLARRGGDQLEQLLKTTLNLRLGQTVIIGATRQPQSGRALMIVISAKR